MMMLLKIKDLMDPLEYLNKKKIGYHDFKLENILFGKDCHLYLADFGLTYCYKDTTPITRPIGQFGAKSIFGVPDTVM